MTNWDCDEGDAESSELPLPATPPAPPMISEDKAVWGGIEPGLLLLLLAAVVVVVRVDVDVELEDDDEEDEEPVLLFAISDTIEVGDVVNEDEDDDDDEVEEEEELRLDAIDWPRMVDDVTEVGGVPAADNKDDDE